MFTFAFICSMACWIWCLTPLHSAREVIYADSAPWVYVSHVVLGVCSMFVLPRQFHMNFVEQNGEGELRTARWLFPLYLFGMTLFIIPIALAGKMLLISRCRHLLS